MKMSMKKILLVEDDTSLRENVEELLELSGFEVLSASNGMMGVELALQQIPDLVLCDIMMPELDGYGVLEQLSLYESTRHIPFIFVSAKTERKEVRKGMDLGADDYLTKPFEEDELLGAIKSRLDKAKLYERTLQGAMPDNAKQGDIRSLNELKNFFDDHGKVLTFQKEDTIYSIGDNANMVYLIVKGMVKCCGLDQEGKELITTIYAEDDFFGFTSLGENHPHQEYAVAMGRVELAGIYRDRLRAILEENKEVSFELMDMISGNLAKIKDQLLQMAYSSVRRKTAQTLLKYSQALNRGKEAPMKVTRNDLAALAGIATESLIRTLSDFKAEGLIAIESRDILVLDREGLEQVH